MRRTILLLLVLLPLFSMAQRSGRVYQEDSSIKLYQGSVQRQLAWAGGFKAPQFAQADLNGDGLKDLVVFEWGEGNMIRTFLNRGTATAAYYTYEPAFAKNFPPCYDYLKLEDYNRDGIADLIHKGVGGFEIWKGYFNSQHQLSFAFYRQLRYNSPFVGNVNAFSQPSDIPAVADVDGDGDLDFFGYDVTGGVIYFYKNCQVELGLPKDSIHVCIPSTCWGHTYQGFLRTYTLGVVPGPGSPLCNSSLTFNCRIINGEQYVKEARHQGNCMLMLDYDGDGDMDLLDGNISYPDIQFLRNGRKDYSWPTDTLVSQDTVWQSGGTRLYMPQWPAAFYVDADGDGKRDILVSPHTTDAGENYKTIAFYKNTGTAAAPVFSYQNDTFLVDQGLDFGTGAYPVLYDYNKDGRPDLFVGSDGYYQPDGTLRSRISYYQNSSVGGVTNFRWVTSDFLGLSAQKFEGIAPTFGDLDGDGDDDLIIGHTDGTLSYYKNTASSGSAQPVLVAEQLPLKDIAGKAIDAGYYATPYVYDINKDGKPDLLIGNQTGTIAFYQNNPTPLGPNLSLASNKLGDVAVIPERPDQGFSSIYIGKIDSTGAEYLISGNGYGNIVRYTGFQSGNVTSPYTLVDTFYHKIDVGLRSAPAFGDIDGDGRFELIAGNRLGGLNLFKQRPPLDVSGPVLPATHCILYPNPAQNEVVISWDATFINGNAPVQVSLLNAMGQVVKSWHGAALAGVAVLSVADLPNGMYICRVAAAGSHQSLKLNVIR